MRVRLKVRVRARARARARVRDRVGVEALVTMVVLQLPPSESSRSRVSFESRYGTYSDIYI